MPRLKKTDAQRRAERFGELYRVGKARLKPKDSDIAAALGVSRTTLSARKHNPDAFPIGQIIRLGGIFGWGEVEYMDIISGGRCGSKMFYVTKDSAIAAESKTRKKAMKYIRSAQAADRRNGMMPEYSIISGGPKETVKYKEP